MSIKLVRSGKKEDLLATLSPWRKLGKGFIQAVKNSASFYMNFLFRPSITLPHDVPIQTGRDDAYGKRTFIKSVLRTRSHFELS